jgi:hypothetical protein
VEVNLLSHIPIMTMSHDNSIDEARTRELVRRVRKLRWMGEHDEAKELETVLRAIRTAVCVFAAPYDTNRPAVEYQRGPRR